MIENRVGCRAGRCCHPKGSFLPLLRRNEPTTRVVVILSLLSSHLVLTPVLNASACLSSCLLDFASVPRLPESYRYKSAAQGPRSQQTVYTPRVVSKDETCALSHLKRRVFERHIGLSTIYIYSLGSSSSRIWSSCCPPINYATHLHLHPPCLAPACRPPRAPLATSVDRTAPRSLPLYQWHSSSLPRPFTTPVASHLPRHPDNHPHHRRRRRPILSRRPRLSSPAAAPRQLARQKMAVSLSPRRRHAPVGSSR